MLKDLIIGVDFGGTKIMSGATDREGNIIAGPFIVPTVGSEDKEKIFSRLTDAIQQAIDGCAGGKIKGIGMGVTGPLDTVNGLILECPQLPTMHFFPLVERVKDRFKLPVIMDNDANALLLGESVWGAGRGHRIVLGYTLGTGLGCAIVVDGKLFTGTNGMAGEIWPSPDGELTIEDTISGRGVVTIFTKLSGTELGAKEIAGLAVNGDRNAIEAWHRFGLKLGETIAWGINTIDPGIVILGGSIANSMDLFCEPMELQLRKYICPVPAKKTRVVKALLGDNAGFLGSAALIQL